MECQLMTTAVAARPSETWTNKSLAYEPPLGKSLKSLRVFRFSWTSYIFPSPGSTSPLFEKRELQMFYFVVYNLQILTENY